MRYRNKTVLVGFATSALILSGCGLGGESNEVEDVKAGSVDPEALKGVEVNVGSKDFDEQLILGQLTIAMLSAAGADVGDETNSQGSTQARNKLINGGSDVYWDYNGTGWLVYLGHDTPIFDPQKQYEAVAKEDLAKNDLVWGQPAPFNNTYAFATTSEFAEENGIETHSDMADYLADNPDSSVCVESEFASRPDGFPGFQKAYGMDIPES
ncbi:MAG: glycine betaine ABC transporter substrate-binding protein, partial [Nocardioidaceae bacterium]